MSSIRFAIWFLYVWCIVNPAFIFGSFVLWAGFTAYFRSFKKANLAMDRVADAIQRSVK